MELHNPLNPIRARSKESRAEMQGIFFLAEARAGDDTDTCRVEETEAVEFVSGTAFGCSGFDGLWWEGNGWEEIHCALFLLDGVEMGEGVRCTCGCWH